MADIPPQAIPPVPPVFTVYDGMVTCRVNDDDEFYGDTPSVRGSKSFHNAGCRLCVLHHQVQRSAMDMTFLA
jgi:hypothetical protein